MNTALIETVQGPAAQLPAAALLHPSFKLTPTLQAGVAGDGTAALAIERQQRSGSRLRLTWSLWRS